jgi:hypothetical protein
VPDGPNKGNHAAVAIGAARWRLVIGDIAFLLCSDDAGLEIQWPVGSVRGKVTDNPFSANFPGIIFGASGDIVVTLP